MSIHSPLVARLQHEVHHRIARLRSDASRTSTALTRAPRTDLTALRFGASPHGEVILPERALREHLHIVGSTGSGKSYTASTLIRQILARPSALKRGLLLIDPHGSHPDSLYAQTLLALHEAQLPGRTIHLFEPNSPTHIIGFNPLSPPVPGVAPDVIAADCITAFERVWGEDLHELPLINKYLSAVFTALVEANLTIAEAPLVFDRGDNSHLRGHLIRVTQNPIVRMDLETLDGISKRRGSTFDDHAMGPLNRLSEFLRNDAVRLMLGTRDHTLDVLSAIDNGDIILANLSPGRSVSDRHGKLLGTLLLRSVLRAAPYRLHPDRTFSVFVDEAPQFFSDDIPLILAETRKRGISLCLMHQNLGQLKDAGMKVYSGVMNEARIKVVHSLTDPDDAKTLARLMSAEYDPETPVQSLTREVVVGHTISTLRSASAQVSDTRSTSSSQTETENVSNTLGFNSSFSQGSNETSALGSSNTDTQSTGHTIRATDSDSQGVSTSFCPFTEDEHEQCEAAETQSPALNWILGREPIEHPEPTLTSHTVSSARSYATALSTNAGTALSQSRSQSLSLGKNRNVSDGKSTSRAESTGTSHSYSEGTATTHGSSEGESEALIPHYEKRVTSIHSLDTLHEIAAQHLRRQKTGQCTVSYAGTHSTVTVPQVKHRDATSIGRVARAFLEQQPSALLITQARSLLEGRLTFLGTVRDPIELESPEGE